VQAVNGVGSTSEPMKILETRRLILRRLQADDLDDLFALYRDPEIRRYFPEGTLTYEETKEELEWFLNGHPDHPELGLWATVQKQTDQFIGRCGLLPWTIEQRPEVEVAYLLGREFRGQGLATEAARATTALLDEFVAGAWPITWETCRRLSLGTRAQAGVPCSLDP